MESLPKPTLKQLRYLAVLLGYDMWNTPSAVQKELAKLDMGSCSSIISNLKNNDLKSAIKQFHYCGISSEIKEEKFLNPERTVQRIAIN